MQPNLNKDEIPALMGIFKKLGLSIPKVLKAQKYLSSSKHSPDEKARKLFGLKPEDNMSQFLEERLNKDEIEILKRNIGI